MRLNSIELKRLSKFCSLRLASCYELPSLKFSYDDFLSFVDIIESGSRPKGGISGEDYGQAISLGGEQIGKDGSLNTSTIPYVSTEFYQEATKGVVRDGDILICKDGALTGKVCLATLSDLPTDQVMINEHVFLIRANTRIRQLFLFYMMRMPFFYEQVIDLAYRKKAQPGLSSEHVKLIKLPEVPLDAQDRILERISPYEKKILEQKKLQVDIQAIIDSVIHREFGININRLKGIDCEKSIGVAFSSFDNRNRTMRFSYRWNKAVLIQNELIATVPCCCKLGDYILSTQNGWSPSCTAEESDYQVLGIDAISKAAILSFNNPKFSSEKTANLQTYTIKDGDFFVSRGNTTDLVALASVAHVNDETPLTVFPDLMIRVDFDERVDCKYMAYVFNSFIGRFYFKYATKGKNQTMVKVSPQELSNFLIPLPDRPNQQRIVDEIQAEISRQDAIKNKIDDLHRQIDGIIFEAIQCD